MKKLILIMSIILLSTGLVGCQHIDKEGKLNKDTSKSNKPAIIGEIVTIEDGRFLVESTTKKLPDEKPNAIWFTTVDIAPLKVGQVVSVWTTAIDHSYPGQANADKMEITE